MLSEVPESRVGVSAWSGVPALADPAEGFGALEDGGDAAEVGGDGAGVMLDVADAVDAVSYTHLTLPTNREV